MQLNTNSQVLACIDEGMNSIGSAGRQTVYWYLAKKSDLKREGIPDHPSEFLEALKNLFGQGAGILERTIMRELKQGFNITLGENLAEVLSLIKRMDSSIGNNHLRTGAAATKSRLED
jgi:hypothetical protein